MTSAAAAAFSAPPAAPGPAAAPAASAPTAAPVAGPAVAASANSNWYDTFESADTKTWVAAKGFKDASAVAESAYNLEKLIGHEKAGRTLVIPKDDDSPEVKAAFAAKLGVPATPNEYKLPLPEGSDPKLVTTIQGWMHKAGATPAVATALTEQFVAFSAAQNAEAETKMLDLSDQALAATTTKWGNKADENLELGKRFANTVLPPEIAMDDGTKLSRGDFLSKIFNTTGATGAMLQLFADAGKGIGEHRIVQGSSNASSNTVQARIAALNNDAGFRAGDKNKVAEMQGLIAGLSGG